MTSSQAEMRALTILLSRKSPAAPSSSKTRGRKPEKFNEVVEKMRRDQHQGVIIENLKEEALAEQYGASRDTCRKARDKVLSEIVGK